MTNRVMLLATKEMMMTAKSIMTWINDKEYLHILWGVTWLVLAVKASSIEQNAVVLLGWVVLTYSLMIGWVVFNQAHKVFPKLLNFPDLSTEIHFLTVTVMPILSFMVIKSIG